MARTGKDRKAQKRGPHTVKITLSIALGEVPGCERQIVDVWGTHGEERPSGPLGVLGHHLRVLGHDEDGLPDHSVLSHKVCRALYQPTDSLHHS